MRVGVGDHEERGNPRNISTQPTKLEESATARPLHFFENTDTTFNMSPRAAIIEEFDDDTDLPLPSHSLPDTGSRGAIIEEIVDSDDDGGDSDEAPEQLDYSASGGPALKPDAREGRVTDITPYKKCAGVYSPTRYALRICPRLT